MASTTALELINKVMLFRRQPPISAYQSTNPEHVATLNAINMAKEDILSTRRWEFDLRTDGQLVTKASLSSLGLSPTPTFTASAGATSGQIALGSSRTIEGDFVARLVPTGDSDYSSTGFRITSAISVMSSSVLSFQLSMPKAFNATEADVIYAEYLLPDTVREVVRVSHEQQELRLEQVGATVEYPEIVPTVYGDTGEPRMIAVGGFDLSTYTTSGTVPAPRLRAVVWPVPDDEYILTYSYYYAHPDLVTETDVLSGVPPAVVNDIVWQATSIMSMAWDGNYAAAHFGDMAQTQASVKNAAYGGQPSRRHTVRSWDSGRSSNMYDESWQTKTIGNS